MPKVRNQGGPRGEISRFGNLDTSPLSPLTSDLISVGRIGQMFCAKWSYGLGISTWIICAVRSGLYNIEAVLWIFHFDRIHNFLYHVHHNWRWWVNHLFQTAQYLVPSSILIFLNYFLIVKNSEPFLIKVVEKKTFLRRFFWLKKLFF